jgi:hypothetical protein
LGAGSGSGSFVFSFLGADSGSGSFVFSFFGAGSGSGSGSESELLELELPESLSEEGGKSGFSDSEEDSGNPGPLLSSDEELVIPSSTELIFQSQER